VLLKTILARSPLYQDARAQVSMLDPHQKQPSSAEQIQHLRHQLESEYLDGIFYESQITDLLYQSG